MTIKLGINGFGRIGRCVLRSLLESGRNDVSVVAVNDLASPETNAHLLKYDSIHGRHDGDIAVHGGRMHVDGKRIRMSSERDPAALDWSDVDVALECTGVFTTREAAARHLMNGARKVLISAPAKGADKTVVFGVNHDTLSGNDMVVSNASCTTNCLSPIAKVLDDSFGIETGYMTTIHSYTGDQPTLDSVHRDLYRARAAGLNMIPTSTGAARAVSEVLPQLKGRLDGSAIRVPTPNVSAIDFCFMPKRTATVDGIHEAVRTAAEGAMRGILGVTDQPLVSSDFNHDPRSSILALDQTRQTQGGMFRIFSWYDNEWAFSNRMLDTANVMGRVH